MNDRELLELAAKAAGHALYLDWNPIVDNEDALTLAVKLHINLTIESYEVCAGILSAPDTYKVLIKQKVSRNLPVLKATRRAIVRAAAQIGREMK